jgi:hypothetical protein
MRLSVVVDETRWRELRDLAEVERPSHGRASVSALVNRLIEEHLSRKRPGRSRREGGPRREADR